MKLYPRGIWIDGAMQGGLEVEFDQGQITGIQSSSHESEDYFLSPGFVNAHSHLEYRGLLGKIPSLDYWPWIRELTRKKSEQSLMQVSLDCMTAARENRATGVKFIAEHSDRPYAAFAMQEAGLIGHIYQELITFMEQKDASSKWRDVRSKMELQKISEDIAVFLAPHAPYTVDRASLAFCVESSERLSIHVAETEYEDYFFMHGKGPISELYHQFGFGVPEYGLGVVDYLKSIGLANKNTQWVHCCAVDDEGIDVIAENQVSVAHCPRSNMNLECPEAPIRKMLDSGIKIGLGLDSAASSGAINMFAEMRAALEVGRIRSEELTPEEVWKMVCEGGAASLDVHNWSLANPNAGMLKIRSGAKNLGELIETASPEDIEWMIG